MPIPAANENNPNCLYLYFAIKREPHEMSYAYNNGTKIQDSRDCGHVVSGFVTTVSIGLSPSLPIAATGHPTRA